MLSHSIFLVQLLALSHQPVAGSIPIKLNESSTVQLDKSSRQDFTINLNKGQYRIFVDTKGTDEDGKVTNVVQGSVKLMKGNGAVTTDLEYDFLGWYEFDAFHREVKVLNLKKNMQVRFRVQNSNLSRADMSLTVTPVSSKKFVDFGFGALIEDAKIDDEQGVGGKFDYLDYRYYRAVLPVGKWSITMGLRRPDGSDSYLAGSLLVLDEMGKRTNLEPAKIDTSSDTARAELILDVKGKPRTVLLRLKNISNNQGTLDYDLTVRKSEE